MSSQNKIVISGYYGFDNIGDEAVLYSIIDAIRRQDIDAKIVVLSNNPEKTSKLYGVEAVNRWKLKEIIKVIKESSLLISGGGSLLQDVTSNKTIIYYLTIVKIAQMCGKPVVYYSQGMGPIDKKFNQLLVKYVSNKVNHIYVREEGSKALLERIGVEKAPITVSIDPVLGIRPKEETIERIKSKLTSGKKVGVYIRPWKNTDQICKELIPSLNKLIEKGYAVYMIPMYYEEDLEVARKIGSQLMGEAYVVEEQLSIDEVVAYTSQFDFIIGMRLHSLIMAAAVKVPMMAISYDPKVRGFMKELGLQGVIDTEVINTKELDVLINRLQIEADQDRVHIKAQYEKVSHRVYMPAAYIKGLLK